MSDYHVPVMLDESVTALITNPQGTYADCTFGGGGHTAEILSRLQDGGRVIAFDRDSDALANAPDDPRLTLVHNNFRFIENYAELLRRGLASGERAEGPEPVATGSEESPFPSGGMNTLSTKDSRRSSERPAETVSEERGPIGREPRGIVGGRAPSTGRGREAAVFGGKPCPRNSPLVCET